MTPAMNAVTTADAIAAAMTACRLPKSEWTHEAHIQAGLSLVLRSGASAALATLREAIPRYNLSTNTPNTDSRGYHDTLTVYYVWQLMKFYEKASAQKMLWITHCYRARRHLTSGVVTNCSLLKHDATGWRQQSQLELEAPSYRRSRSAVGLTRVAATKSRQQPPE